MSAIVLPHLWEDLCGLIWPPRCPACDVPCAPTHEPVLAFCELCAEALVPVTSPRCPICALPFDGVGPDHACGQCLRSPPAFDSAFAAFEYGGPAATACLRFKAGKAHLARPLGQILASLAADLPQVDIVAPVPLHNRRLARRGYNPSALLATHLAAAIGAPLCTAGLWRTRNTPSQTQLNINARKKNLEGAFLADERTFGGLRVLLVDDVLTTTATCRAASRALRHAGAAQIHVACLLRAT